MNKKGTSDYHGGGGSDQNVFVSAPKPSLTMMTLSSVRALRVCLSLYPLLNIVCLTVLLSFAPSLNILSSASFGSSSGSRSGDSKVSKIALLDPSIFSPHLTRVVLIPDSRVHGSISYSIPP